MNFVVITHVPHIKKQEAYFGYAPYIREMNIWLQYVDKVTIVAPLENKEVDAIYLNYDHKTINFVAIPNFNITSIVNILQTLLKLPSLLVTIFLAMKKADHIHLRCPGNIGLLGCLVQICFPKTPKTAKYAGNWDPNAKQPLSYKLQKRILNNTFLTKNMQVLVYGEWQGVSKNIKSFFTATYSETQKEAILVRSLNETINFVFVGTLSDGKRPLFAIQLVKNLHKAGKQVQLHLFGDGALRQELENYISHNKLADIVFLHGNQNKETVEKAYKECHFLILASKSEGWPKVVAEAMFWGCLPLTTDVSCVNFMIGNGARGHLLHLHLEKDTQEICNLLQNEIEYKKMCMAAIHWSQAFTTEYFEKEIAQLLRSS